MYFHDGGKWILVVDIPAQISPCNLLSIDHSLTLVLPTPFFCNMVYQGGGYHPPYELEIDGPKVWLFGTMV